MSEELQLLVRKSPNAPRWLWECEDWAGWNRKEAEVTESRALTLKTLTSAGRNLIFLTGCLPPSITTGRPPLLIASVPVLINERPPRFNLLTMCNAARSANSLHCPDLLYTSRGSGGLLGCSLTRSPRLCRVYFSPLASLHLLFFPTLPSFCHLSFSFKLFLALLGWTSTEINRADVKINQKNLNLLVPKCKLFEFLASKGRLSQSISREIWLARFRMLLSLFSFFFWWWIFFHFPLKKNKQ